MLTMASSMAVLGPFSASRRRRWSCRRDELFLVERREVFALRGAQIAAGAFDPEHFDGLAGEGIFLA